MKSNALNVADMKRYIASATGTRSDTQHDRIVDVFWQLRRDLPVQGWHRIEGLREFCTDLSDHNPFVPPVIAQMEYMTRHMDRKGGSFVSEWKGDGRKAETLDVDMRDFARTVRADTQATALLQQRSGGNAQRFYAKMAEWHVCSAMAAQTGAQTIIDLGTTDDSFARIVQARLGSSVRIDMVDTDHPTRREPLSEGVRRVDADVRDLSAYADDSVDLVCMLNSLEHFTGRRDSEAMAEVERILQPGGMAVIVPFRAAFEYILSVQPISCFLAPPDEGIAQDLEDEIREGECLVRYNHRIISPFARSYDYVAANRRVLSQVPNMEAGLLQLRFDGLSGLKASDLEAGDDIPAMPPAFADRRDMLALTLTKPES